MDRYPLHSLELSRLPFYHTVLYTPTSSMFTLILTVKITSRWKAWTGLIWLWLGTGCRLFKDGNELPVSTKCGKCFDYLRKCWLLYKDFVPWIVRWVSQLISYYQTIKFASDKSFRPSNIGQNLLEGNTTIGRLYKRTFDFLMPY